MKIAVTTLGCDAGRSGIGQYVKRLLREFAVMAPASFHVIAHKAEVGDFMPDGLPLHPILVADRLRDPLLNVLWHQTQLPWMTKKQNFDVVFLPAANRRLPWYMPRPTVGTVHDFSSIHIEGKYDPARAIYIKQVLPRLINRLTHVISVSESTKKDIVEYAGYPEDRVTVIPHGVDHDVFYPRDRQESQAAIPAKYRIRPPFILYVSRLEHPGKNHVGLIEAFALAKDELKCPHQLVLAGSDWTRAEQIHQAAEKSRWRDDILFTGFLPAADLPALYCAADLVAFPSLFEGFGLPILEAMACGTPVACSNLSSMPEVGGDAVIYFDPKNPLAIAQAITKLVTDKASADSCQRRGLERSRQFTWANAAKRTLAVLQMAAQR